MKKFAARSDMEGLYGVVCWPEVIPGTPTYEGARAWLHEEVEALAQGLKDGGGDYLEIYDEHYYGLNIDPGRLPAGVGVIRGKPPYRADWAGGIDRSYSGLILQGYHAMTGTTGGILPHTYEPDIAAIHLNGKRVGEIGVEAAIAGDQGVPLVLYVGDRHGADEARALVPAVETVVVKDGMGAQQGLCRNGAEVRAAIRAAAARVAAKSEAKPLVFAGPVTLKVTLFPGPFRDRLRQDRPEWKDGDDAVAIPGPTVTAAWADYWAAKDLVLAAIKK